MTNSKFFPFQKYLENSSLHTVSLSFTDIENILGFPLCDSAYKHRAYWSLSKTHIFPQAVEDAGYFIKEVDITSQRAIFERK